MRTPKTHTFNGKKYDIAIEDLDGLVYGKCDYCIVIERDLNKRVGLETAVHEALHACCWSKSEKFVDRTAKDIARFLWRLGYRNETDNN